MFLKSCENSREDKGNSVFFCCHPDDFEPYFEIIKKDIFKAAQRTIKYSIYYMADEKDTEKQGKEDESFSLEEQLSQMRLFVIPITKKFLETSNDAREKWLPIAQENDIQLLPILMEPECMESYQKQYPSIQYLEHDAQDPTAVPYADKLENALNMYLYSYMFHSIEEIQERLKRRIFLSYRKLDRQKAQKLMQSVHQDEKRTNVAIWYDESLRPGDDFNKEIITQEEKSDCFLLLLTPYMTENRKDGSKNYVVQNEFPLAKDRVLAGKMEWLAVETEALTKKQREKAEKDFPGIPILPFDCKDDEKNSAFNRLIYGSETAPQLFLNALDQYYLGFAYYYGIDVERNRERALSLFQQSADGNCIQAVSRLALMYQYGMGVSRDLHKAIKLMGECIDRTEQRKNGREEKEPSARMEWYCSSVTWIYNELKEKDKCEVELTLGATEKLIKIQTKNLKMEWADHSSKDTQEKYERIDMMVDRLAWTYICQYLCYKEKLDLQGAYQALQSMLKLRKDALAVLGDSPKRTNNVAWCYGEIAVFLDENKNRTPDEEKMYLDALCQQIQYKKALLEKDNNPEYINNLIWCYGALADHWRAIRERTEKENEELCKVLRNQIKYGEQLLQDSLTEKRANSVLWAYGQLETVYKRTHQREEQKKILEKRKKLTEALYNRGYTVNSVLFQADYYISWAKFCRTEGNKNDWKQYLQLGRDLLLDAMRPENLEKLQAAEEQPDSEKKNKHRIVSEEIATRLSGCYRDIADYWEENREEDQNQNWRENLLLAKKQMQYVLSLGFTDHRAEMLTRCNGRINDYCEKEGDTELQQTTLRENLGLLEQMKQTNKVFASKAHDYGSFAELARNCGDAVQEETYCRAQIASLKSIPSEKVTPKQRGLLGRGYGHLGLLLMSLGRTKEGKEDLFQAVNIMAPLPSKVFEKKVRQEEFLSFCDALRKLKLSEEQYQELKKLEQQGRAQFP